jgi:hypothetical protein
VVSPTGKTLPEGGVHATLTLAQLSDVGGENTAIAPAELVAFTVTFGRRPPKPSTGASTSWTVTVNAQGSN